MNAAQQALMSGTTAGVHSSVSPRPFWPPLVAGIVLGLVLLLTFVLTGHGLGATGFFTRLAAAGAAQAAPTTLGNSSYFAPLLDGGRPLSSWITWQVLGLAVGAGLSAWWGRRFRIQFDGSRGLGTPRRGAVALIGGLFAGFGARISAGCTSGLGLSGAAVLSLAGMVFLVAFFVVGLVFSRLVRSV